ncbi:MAG: hypothetical protein AMXMBFR6_02660 [Betaproteobacteria bacterium]
MNIHRSLGSQGRRRPLHRAQGEALGIALALFAGSPLAADYRSATEAAILYDGPTTASRPVLILLAGTPVELIVGQAGWSKIRIAEGKLLWIESRRLSERRNLIVTAAAAEIRALPGGEATATTIAAAPLAFRAEQGVLLERLSDPAPSGWVKVRHRDGETGFVRMQQVWGY